MTRTANDSWDFSAVAAAFHRTGQRSLEAFMKFGDRSLMSISEMICGDLPMGAHFPYRSSSRLTEFFRNCGMNYAHSSMTRRYWVKDVLTELNLQVASAPDLPSDSMLRVLYELMDPVDFETADPDGKID